MKINFSTNKYLKILFVLCVVLMSSCVTSKVNEVNIGLGWSNNSINTVKFRKNALTTFKDYQFIAYYDADSFLTLGKRKSNAAVWEKVTTKYKGNTNDAHNSISIIVDGDGYLHVSWDHHNTKLRYSKSTEPLSLELGEEKSMTGAYEKSVSYPEFYNLPNGDLLFFYRSGASGRGNMVINSYSLKNKEWSQLQNNLIDGQEQRSAYWQASIDNQGVIHVSWVWRETWGVETNHDMCYARSKDGGKTWEKSTGEKYKLPIIAKTAEYAWEIPQNSSLINQTAMTTDKNGNPFIASYWVLDGIPQYQIVYHKNDSWQKINTDFRKTAFVLGGGGTKKIPIARPELLINDNNGETVLHLLFRDEERGSKMSLASRNIKENSKWEIKDLTNYSLGEWEPNYDIPLWNKKKQLHVFIQKVTQIDGEGLTEIAPSMVGVLELNNLSIK